jgi:hypothetical protein
LGFLLLWLCCSAPFKKLDLLGFSNTPSARPDKSKRTHMFFLGQADDKNHPRRKTGSNGANAEVIDRA